MIKSQRYKFLYRGKSVYAEKLIKTFNSYLRVVGFLTVPFANNGGEKSSTLDIRPHVLVVGNIHYAF